MSSAKELYGIAENLFGKKLPLTSLHQEIADNFYPERADFTVWRSMGSDFGSQLMTSYPILCRRDLGNQFGTMLRPTARPWFHNGMRDVKKEMMPNEVKSWLQYFEDTQRKCMYDPITAFTRATKEADHDFAAFGQTVLSVEMARNRLSLLFRCWHLRDCAWQENESGTIGFFARRWKTAVNTLIRTFGDKLNPKFKEMAGKDPFEHVTAMHMVLDAEMYDDDGRGRPRWSIWWDCEHQELIEATPIWNKHYVVPRWQTVSGSQYSYSPATVAGLPDARLIQAMTYTLLEAGEKATNPPLVATVDAVKSDMNVYAGGVTWVDAEYDERLGDALRPLNQDFRGFDFGVKLNENAQAMLHKAFYLDTLTLPQRTAAMTAYEVSQQVQEYIRGALPLFEPMEGEYNAALCDEVFEVLWRQGTFGPVQNWPSAIQQALAAGNLDFNFESPLHDAIDQQKGELFQSGAALISAAVALDPSMSSMPKAEVVLRDALSGIGWPADWMNDEIFVAAAKKQQQNATAQQGKLAAMESASNSAKNIGQSGLVPNQGPGATSGQTA